MRVDVQETFRLALPVMVARAGLLVITAVDTIMSGRVGADQLAYYAIGSAPVFLFMLLGIGLATGTVVLVAQAIGAGRTMDAGRIWRIACIDIALAGVLAGLMLLPGEAILGALDQSPDVVAGGAKVMRASAIGMPAALLFTVTSYFLEAIGRPHPGMIVMWLGNLLNLCLNWLLMFAPFGLSTFGAEGAAFATSITRIVMVGALVAYAFRFAGHRAFGVRGKLGDIKPVRRQLLRLGLPFAASQGLESSAFQFIMVMAGWLGTEQLAAHQAAININALVYMLTLGLATATSVRVGQAVGRHRPKEIGTAGWVGTALGVLIMLGCVPLIVLFRADIGAIYTSDPGLVVLIAATLLLVCPTMVVDSGQGILTAALRGTGDTWIPTAIHVGCFWPVMVGTAWYLAFAHGYGLVGLWLGLFSGLGLASVLLGIRFAWRSRVAGAPARNRKLGAR